LFSVVPPINFNDKPSLYTTEISEIRPDRELTPEFKSSKLSVTQTNPKYFFRRGLIKPQLTGGIFSFAIVRY